MARPGPMVTISVRFSFFQMKGVDQPVCRSEPGTWILRSVRQTCLPVLLSKAAMNSSLVVIDDDHEVAQLGERRGGTEIENGRRAFKRRVPEFLSVEIIRERPRPVT